MTTSTWMATLAAVAFLSACGDPITKPDDQTPSTDSADSSEFVNWPTTLDEFRFRWTAEPGIDLTTGPGVVIRAYLESYDVASYTFDLGTSYPGFLRATPPNTSGIADDALYQLVSVRPLGVDYTVTPDDARPHFGFVPLHVLELAKLGDGYEATVCSADYGSYVESVSRPGKFVSLGTDDKTGRPLEAGATSGIGVHRIEFTQHDPRVGSTPPPSPTAPQTGSAPAPGGDVFGSWFVTGASTKFWGPVEDPSTPDFPTPELQQRCADSMPQNEAERTAMMTGYKDAPPPHGEAIPGWPAQAK